MHLAVFPSTQREYGRAEEHAFVIGVGSHDKNPLQVVREPRRSRDFVQDNAYQQVYHKGNKYVIQDGFALLPRLVPQGVWNRAGSGSERIYFHDSHSPK